MAAISKFFSTTFNYFSTISAWDLVDILIVAYIIYEVIRVARHTSSSNLAKGILVLIIAIWLSSVLNLTMINFLLRKVVEIGLIALVIIFQPELRKLLAKVGSSKFYGLFSGKEKDKSTIESAITQTVLACEQMAKTKTGALVIFERNILLGNIMMTGTVIDADCTAELVKNVFYPKAPLHDGAMIMRNGRIAAAGCVLPLTNKTNLSKDLGMRHRAGIGVSEQTDALVIIVSEETGAISIAIEGMLKRNLNHDTFEKILRSQILQDEPGQKSAGQLFGRIKGKLKVKKQ